MRLLFEMDEKDYNPNGRAFVRPSSRAIIIKNNKIYMIHSLTYNYYTFPGGGIEKNETKIDALIRETKEEAGLIVIKDSIKSFGYVHRVCKSNQNDFDYFIQNNYYYLCDVEENMVVRKLDDYETLQRFTLEAIDYRVAIDKHFNILKREAMVLEILHKEGYLK